ncbi:MAG: S49 family peptidase, partial [Pyrobaculum sp.]
MASKLLYLGAAIAIALGAAALAIIIYSGFVEPIETTPRIVLVNIDSVLEDQYVWDVVKKLIEISQRPDVVGVVLVINSPGGTVSATETLYTTVKGLNKTKYSVVTGLAASGAYYVAVATEKIFATPSSWVGSIGVVAILWPDTYLYDLPDYIYTTGPMKYHGRDLLDFYNDVERIRLNFVKAVLEGREGRVKADPRVFETASIFTASEALEMGLVDEIGGVFDAVRDMAKKLRLDKYVVVKLEELYNLSRGAPRLSVDAKFL